MPRIPVPGIILSVDYSLKDQLKGYIQYEIDGQKQVIPFYHPKCEKFYPESGRKCKFTIDVIKIDCDGPYNDLEFPQLLAPTFLEKVRGMIEKAKELFEQKEAPSGSTPVTFGGVLNYYVTNSVGGAGRKVAVDLEDDDD